MRRLFFVVTVCMLLGPPRQVVGVGLPAGTLIHIVANADYTNDLEETNSSDPASVTLTVLQVAGVQIEAGVSGDQVEQGKDIYFPLSIINKGNAPDSMNLSAVSQHGWSISFIYDENADGTHQDTEEWEITNTQMVVADGYCPCFAKISVPDGVSIGDTVTVTAASVFDAAEGLATAHLDVPAPGLKPTMLTISAEPESPYIGQMVTISGELQPAMQRQVEVICTAPSGAKTTYTISTSEEGKFQVSFAAQSVGAYQIEATFASVDGYAECSSDLEVQVSAKTVTSISMTASPAEPIVGDNIILTGDISPALVSPLAITCVKPDGSSTQSEVTTDDIGHFTWSVSGDAVGDWRISASYAGAVSHEACSNEITVNVQEPPLPPEHKVTITTGPSLTPEIVDSSGSTQCDVVAEESQGHDLTYLWSDGGAGGTFSPSADVQNPTYTASANATGSDVPVTLTCTVTCAQDSQVSAEGEAILTVHSIPLVPPQVVSIEPADGSSCVSSSAAIVVRFDKAMDEEATQLAVSLSPGLESPVYSWSVDGMTLTITHQGLASSATYICAVTTAAKDANGVNLADEYTWTFSTVSAAMFDTNEMTTELGAAFTTPRIVLDDPTLPASVTFSVSIPEGISVDPTTVDGSLTCIEAGSGVTTLQSEWDSLTREIVITAEIADPSVNVEIVESITLTAPLTAGVKQLSINGCPALDVHIDGYVPGDFDSDELVKITDASLFIQQWVRWHQTSLPVFDPITDGLYDLAPHSSDDWPAWTPSGDGTINIQDAMAFIGCWVGAHSSQPSSSAASEASRALSVSKPIVVEVREARAGTFEVCVEIPADARFDACTDSAGNLINATRGDGAGNLFFSEYDPDTRTVRLTGEIARPVPCAVAIVYVGY